MLHNKELFLTTLSAVLKEVCEFEPARGNTLGRKDFTGYPVFFADQADRCLLDRYYRKLTEALRPVAKPTVAAAEVSVYLMLLGLHPMVMRPELSYAVYSQLPYSIKPMAADAIRSIFGNVILTYFAYNEAVSEKATSAIFSPTLHYVARCVAFDYQNAVNKQPVSELIGVLHAFSEKDTYLSSRLAAILGMSLYDFSKLLALLKTHLSENTYTPMPDFFTPMPSFLKAHKVSVECPLEYAHDCYVVGSMTHTNVDVKPVEGEKPIKVAFCHTAMADFTLTINPYSEYFVLIERDTALRLVGAGTQLFLRFLLRYGSFSHFVEAITATPTVFRNLVKMLSGQVTLKSTDPEFFAPLFIH